MIGIYKITSSTNRIYIGQTIDIDRRFTDYKKYLGKKQPKLKYSFKKHGIENHLFEIIEECEIEKLNERERYWQDFYDVLNGGLNCKLTETNDRSGIFSNEIKEKMSISRTGKIFTEEHKSNISKGQIGNKRDSSTGEKISLKKKGIKLNYKNEETKQKSLNNIIKNDIKVIDTETNIIYDTIKEASKSVNYSPAFVSMILSGKRKNNTNLKYFCR